MITTSSVAEFLAGQRIAVIGASDDKANFGATIYRALREYGYDVVAVNPNAEAVAGDRCYADLGSVPAPIDGAIVMVNQALAVDVVRACAEHHVQLCRDNSIDVVAGACPLMFLEPVGWFHKVHRSVRHLNGSLSKAS
jgi:uncharacterized protein